MLPYIYDAGVGEGQLNHEKDVGTESSGAHTVLQCLLHFIGCERQKAVVQVKPAMDWADWLSGAGF